MQKRLRRAIVTVVAVAGLFIGWPQGLQAQESDRTFHAGHACRTLQLLQNLRDMPGGPQLRDRPSMVGEQVLSTADDRFQIHYSEQALALAGITVQPDLQPDLVEQVSEALAAARFLLVDQGGWRETWGDLPLDVYLHTSGRAASRAVPLYDPTLSPEERTRSFMVLSGPPLTWAVQAVHQYIHVLQLGYSVHEAAWFYEASALYLEEIMADGGAIPAELVSRRMHRPHLSLASARQALRGGAVVFLAYVAETRGPAVLRLAWERASLGPGENSVAALDTALRLTDLSTFPEVWREFVLWNAYPEPSLRPSDIYSTLSVPVPAARPARVITDLPSSGTEALVIEPLGAAYLHVRDVGDVGSLQLELETDSSGAVAADVLVSWRHGAGGWLAVPVRFKDGHGSLGIPVEPGGEVIIALRHDGSEARNRRVDFSLYADPSYPFDLAFLVSDASLGQIDLSWGSERENHIYGWMIYRAEDPQGPFRPVNRFPLPSIGDSQSPLAYHYTDHNVTPGHLYFYQVEGITVDGLARRSGVIARRATAWPEDPPGRK